jgi:predicted DNA-binding ArsR family transcriptional regulator
MQYFNSLPKIIYTDAFGISRIFTNIISRISILPSILKNPLVYYKYDIQDGDTPEIIAYKYYGESYRYWIVLFANQLLDPQWDWPMAGNVLEKYIVAKYSDTNVYTTTHHFEKIITHIDNQSLTTTTDVVVIDESEYNSLVESTNTFTIPTSPTTTVTVNTTKRLVNIYEYELELNESKRNINILNVSYVEQLEQEFIKLMSS